HGGLSVSADWVELELVGGLRQRENVSGFLHKTCVEEILELLLAEAVDVESAARHEQVQMLNLLERAGDTAAAAQARALLARRGFLAHHVGVQRARTFLRKMEFL